MPVCASEVVASTSYVPVWAVLTKISVPATCANGLDSESVTTGAEGAELSIVTARRSKSPSASAVVSQLTEYGAVASVSMAVQAPPPAGRRSNPAEATPEPESAELDETTSVPVTNAPSPGAVRAPVGSVRSTVTSTMSSPVLSLPSVATARSARFPSGSIGQEAEYGALESAPRETQVPPPHPALASEQRKNSTSSTSPSGVVAVTVNGSGEAPFTNPAGAVTVTLGAALSTVTARVADVRLLPASSVVTTRRS